MGPWRITDPTGTGTERPDDPIADQHSVSEVTEDNRGSTVPNSIYVKSEDAAEGSTICVFVRPKSSEAAGGTSDPHVADSVTKTTLSTRVNLLPRTTT
jgi:uncharacterized ParB-like nuclease family protein